MTLLRSVTAAAIAFLTSGALGDDRICLPYIAATPLEFADDLSQVRLAFVGRVVGFRLNDTTLTDKLPGCPIRGADLATRKCKAFWKRVVSVQFEVEMGIKSIEGGRKYETPVSGYDKCLLFDVGERWLYTEGYPRPMVELPEMPSAEELESLRRDAAS